jgi:hypothetical protein
MRILAAFVIAALIALLFPPDVAAAALSAAQHHEPGLLDQVGQFLATNGVVVFGATLGTTALTLLDRAKRMDPNDQVARIIELLSQTNEILEDMPFMEGNLTTGHRTTVRTGLPTPTWRLLNGGVLPTKSRTAQIDEQCGLLEAYSQVDKALADLGGNSAALRLSEARAHIEGMNQEMASTLFYGAATAPEEFIGLSARYNDSTAGNGSNVIKAGGAGSDNTSIWLICWDEETISGIYPKGTNAGLGHEDLGLETTENAGGVTGALNRVYRDHWMWNCGIALKDWRYVVRICNIDVSDLTGGSAADLIDYMEQAEEIIPNSIGRRAFYMNRTIRRYLRKQTRADVSTGGGITFENVAGKRVRMFGETPVRITDALLNTEATVS